MWVNISLLVLGIAYMGYAIYSIIAKRYNKKKVEQYTIESLIKANKVSSIFDIVVGLSIVIVGLAWGSWLLTTTWVYVGVVIVIVSIFVDTFSEGRFLVKKETENKE